MSTGGGILKVGKFYPDPNRHIGFGFVDRRSGAERSLGDLSDDPQDPDLYVATLNTRYEGDIVVPGLVVVMQKGLVQEARSIVATIEQPQLGVDEVVSEIAVGSLVLWLKNR